MSIRHLCNLLLVPALLTGLTLSISSANPSSSPEDAVFIKDEPRNVHWYQNNFLGFKMAIPGGWHVTLNKEVAWYIHDTYTRKHIKEGIVTPLLAISKYPPGKPGPQGQFNSNIILIAHNLSQAPPPGIRSAKELVDVMKATGEKFSSAPYNTKDGESDCQRFRWLSNQGRTHSPYGDIVCIKNGYAIFLQPMAESDAEISEIESILQTLHFD